MRCRQAHSARRPSKPCRSAASASADYAFASLPRRERLGYNRSLPLRTAGSLRPLGEFATSLRFAWSNRFLNSRGFRKFSPRKQLMWDILERRGHPRVEWAGIRLVDAGKVRAVVTDPIPRSSDGSESGRLTGQGGRTKQPDGGRSKMPDQYVPIISLFCGAGGLDLGFRREKFKALLALDHSQAAINSFNLNTKSKVGRIADLATITPSQIVALMEEVSPEVPPVGIIGGPPCQGFSRGNVCTIPNDPRNLLPFKYAETLRYLNDKFALKFFVFENVMGLKTPRHRDRFEAIQKEFKGAGFRVFSQTLNASSFGVPQNRPRLFIVGLNEALFPEVDFMFPKGRTRRKFVRQAIEGLPAPAFFKPGMSVLEIPHHPNHWTMMPKSPKLTTQASSNGRSFRRLIWDEVSPTVAYGNREIHVHPDGGRRLSVHEAMLLQGFPPKYRLWGNFSQQITQVSNAVPPPVAKALAHRIRRTLRLFPLHA